MNLKRTAMTGVALLLIAGIVLGGCGKDRDTNSAAGSSNSSASSSTTDSNLELSVAAWDIQTGFDNPNAKNDTIYNDLTAKFNVKIKPVQVTWNDWQDKAKVWAASSQLPDIFVNSLATDNPGLYTTWAKQGVIKAIPDDLSAYPNLQKIFSLPSVQPLKVNGKFYMIPRMSYDDSSDWVLDRPIRYRKDWAAQAGFTSEPESFDDFVKMTQAVMKQHPGIIGLSTNNQSYLLTLFLGSFPELTNIKTWVKENDKWIPAFASEKAYTGIEQLRSLYTDGILDKDIAIQKDADGVSKFLAGQSFAVFGLGTMTDDKLASFTKANPGVSASNAIGYMNIWPAADGKRYTFVETPYWSETYFPSSLSDEKFERALKLMDYLASEEFAGLMANGIENVDYKIDNGKSVSLLKDNESLGEKYPITKNLAFLGTWNNGFLYTGKQVVSRNSEMAALQQDQIDTYNKFKSEDTPTPIDFNVFLLSTPAKDKLGSLKISDDIVKVILEKGDPITVWKNILKGYDSKGVQDAIKEVNAEAAKQGIQ
ncbi:extracellular solute-binding protein [Paenibacillus sp. GCM10012307]|uniref:Extracellular solute-binding protein n=1 Tax=Paenibacillus roseus TaxID=2798579 RepID=A0A934MPR6_9BACL|nr:extracellular solute-binding protein [Paenibacillus roseus]MBJ6361148.1 extracellular solute-binding protein [Paenibacillus roseus]